MLQSAPSSGIQTTTLRGGSGENYTLGSALTNNGANITGRWVVSGTNNFTGATTINGGILEVGNAAALSQTGAIAVNTGGTLLLSGAGGTNTKLKATAAVTLAANSLTAASLALSGITSSFEQQVGALTLSLNSVIDFGTFASGNTLRFADSSGVTWAGGRSQASGTGPWDWITCVLGRTTRG